MQRNRPAYAVLIATTIATGLASRSRLADYFPTFIGEYAGDTLWALTVFLVIALVFPRLRIPLVAVAAIAISFMVEASQLYQAEWLNRIRTTWPGALALGSGFLWSDLVCYTVGVLIGGSGEFLWTRLRANKSTDEPS